LPDPSLAGAGQAPTEERLQGLARYILEERARRRWHFPRVVFDEIPWEMLLLLYASESRSLSKAALVNGILVAPEVVDRWIDYLELEGLITRLHDPGGSAGLQLTSAGLASLELYLSDRLQRAEDVSSGRRRGEGAGLPGWAVALLLLGTAILSGAMSWSLAVR
jgi:hypothetical protein